MARRKAKAYSEAFRKQAVRLADLPDRTATDVARELGILLGKSITGVLSLTNYRKVSSRLQTEQITRSLKKQRSVSLRSRSLILRKSVIS